MYGITNNERLNAVTVLYVIFQIAKYNVQVTTIQSQMSRYTGIHNAEFDSMEFSETEQPSLHSPSPTRGILTNNVIILSLVG